MLNGLPTTLVAFSKGVKKGAFNCPTLPVHAHQVAYVHYEQLLPLLELAKLPLPQALHLPKMPFWTALHADSSGSSSGNGGSGSSGSGGNGGSGSGDSSSGSGGDGGGGGSGSIRGGAGNSTADAAAGAACSADAGRQHLPPQQGAQQGAGTSQQGQQQLPQQGAQQGVQQNAQQGVQQPQQQPRARRVPVAYLHIDWCTLLTSGRRGSAWVALYHQVGDVGQAGLGLSHAVSSGV